MNSKNKIFLCSLAFLALVGWSSLQADEPPIISTSEVREELLDLADMLLKSESPDFYERMQAVPNPYVVYVEVLVEEGESEQEIMVRKDSLSDITVLKTLAGHIKPKGSMIMAGKNVLITENAGKLRVGNELPFTIRDITYKVIVANISGKTYTLKLNDKELIIDIRGKPGRGTIEFDKP